MSYRLFHALRLALDPKWPRGEYCPYISWMQIVLGDAEIAFNRRYRDPFIRPRATEELPNDLIMALSSIGSLPLERVLAVFDALHKYDQYKVADSLMGKLPGGKYLRIRGGGDYTRKRQIIWRMRVLPKLCAITISHERYVAARGRRADAAFLRKIGAWGLTQNDDDLSIRLYFKDEEQAVLQKLKL